MMKESKTIVISFFAGFRYKWFNGCNGSLKLPPELQTNISFLIS